MVNSIGTAIGRDYSTITAWEAATEGDLVSMDVISKGECYNDSQFKEHPTISGSITDNNHYVWLTTGSGESHIGIAATGVTLTKTMSGPILTINDKYTRLENLEVFDATSQMVQIFGEKCLLNRLILHDVFEGTILNISLGGSGTEVRNCIIYNGNNAGIRANDDAICKNVTVYNLRTNGVGFHVQGATLTVINCMATNSTTKAFGAFGQGSFSAESKNNLSDDDSAPGPNSLHFVSASDLFKSIVQDQEDFHLKSGSPAINAGVNLSNEFMDDIDGQLRSTFWDIGADEFIASKIPGVPQLLSPANNAIDLPPEITFSWNILPNAEWYHLQVSEESNFNTIFFEDSLITQTKKTVGSLPLRKTFYWRVRGLNSLGVGSWSSVRSFTTTEVLLEPPILVSPKDKEINLPPEVTFTWEKVEGALKYHLQLSEDREFTTLIFNDSLITNLEIQFGPLELGKKYYWRVRAGRINYMGPWSEIRSFTVTPVILLSPVLIAPQNGSTNISPTVTFSWQTVEGAQKYRLQVARDSTFNFNSLVFENGNIKSTEKKVGPFARGQKHFWRVRAETNSVKGPWSDIWSFTTGTVTIVDSLNDKPVEYALYPNYPNPFNEMTVITYSIPYFDTITMKIYDLNGREIKTLVQGAKNPGTYRIRWDGRNNQGNQVSSGVYFCRMQTKKFKMTRKILFVK
ncbi:MAG: T9SS C-terminal target domain-containing protein [Calditrichaeota bacterium]|nr:MAG: T9SS C-terminal target domain-containing protein [Calditrichota bacterium]